jgi:hypothetical protein
MTSGASRAPSSSCCVGRFGGLLRLTMEQTAQAGGAQYTGQQPSSGHLTGLQILGESLGSWAVHTRLCTVHCGLGTWCAVRHS